MIRRAILLALALLAAPLAARANNHITFGLDWKAEAEYGGFY
jgi:NitT/TauT family transport system substrate-binding protein